VAVVYCRCRVFVFGVAVFAVAAHFVVVVVIDHCSLLLFLFVVEIC